MVTTTSSVPLARPVPGLPPASVTVSVNVRVVGPVNSGTVNVVVAVAAPVSVMVGAPPVCRQA